MDPSFGCSGNRLRPASGVPLSTISPSTRRSALGTDAGQAPVRGMSGSYGSYEQGSGATEDSETTWGAALTNARPPSLAPPQRRRWGRTAMTIQSPKKRARTRGSWRPGQSGNPGGRRLTDTHHTHGGMSVPPDTWLSDAVLS